jgi:Ricin-type beta-trefoil lectin domain-like
MRTSLMRMGLLTPTLLALLFVAAGSAHGNELNTNLIYRITARDGGRCLDVSGGYTWSGADVIQWDCHDGENQQWLFTRVAEGFYKITARHSGKVLDVFGGIISQGDGVVVQQRDYNGADNQIWSVRPVADGSYVISAKHSGKSLSVVAGNGTQAKQFGFSPGTNQYNQQWILTPVAGCP